MISVKIDGVDDLQEWQSINIKQSMGTVQHSVDISVTDVFDFQHRRYNHHGGGRIEIFLDKNYKLFDGWVQRYKESATATSRTINVSAESSAVDLVQSSHIGKYFWQNCTAETVINEVVKPFNIKVKINKPLLPISKEGLRVAVDTTAFDILKKVAEQNGLLIFTDTNGVINIGLPATNQGVLLTTGDYTQISIDHDFTAIFSKLIIKSQQKTHEKKKFKHQQQKQTVIDNDRLIRYRPKIVISNGEEKQQENLANYANRRINGDGIKVNLTVKSLYDKNGKVWAIGDRVWLREPNMDIDNELIISDLTFSISQTSGTNVQMNLKVPQTFTLTKPSNKPQQNNGIFTDLIDVLAKPFVPNQDI